MFPGLRHTLRERRFNDGYEKTLIGPPLWLSAETLQAIIEEASGELARNHFRRLSLMGGYAPSPSSGRSRITCGNRPRPSA